MKQYRVRREEDLWNVMPICKGCYGKIKWEAGPKKGARQGGEKNRRVCYYRRQDIFRRKKEFKISNSKKSNTIRTYK